MELPITSKQRRMATAMDYTKRHTKLINMATGIFFIIKEIYMVA